MSDDLEESGPRKRIPKNITNDDSSELNDSTEQQPLSSDSPNYPRRPAPRNTEPYRSDRQRDDQRYGNSDNRGNRSYPPRSYNRSDAPNQRYEGNRDPGYRQPPNDSRPRNDRYERGPSDRQDRNYRPYPNDRREGGYQPRSNEGPRYDRQGPNDRSYPPRRYDRPYDDRPRDDRPRYDDRNRGPANRDSFRPGNRDSGGPRGGRQDFRGRRTTQQRPTNITKALVRLLYASRGFSLKVIRDGMVSLNGAVIRNPNASVRLLQDEVRVNDVVMVHNPNNIYVVMNKPKKFAGSREQDSRHIMNLISKKVGWYIPGGPLAKSVSGIIILTNDPEQSDIQSNVFALMDKEYWIKVNAVLTKRDISKLATKLEALHDDNKGRVIVEIAQKNVRHTWISITLRKARVHDITKIVANSGLEILAIERRRIGSISVADLPAGSWRRLSEAEVHTMITSSVSRASVEELAVQDQEVPTEQPSVWQKLYQRWFKST